ncbi:MAG TPA: tetratricopeptide repeat protein, partial [Thermoanaerobaculia bacterium]|nr:tetratricopeptide repeat protein [Thermoanaerobaculia bacterium]
AVRVICEQAPAPLRAHWSGVRRPDRDLETIVGKGLEKGADRRYGSVGEMRDDIDRYLASQPILARSPSAMYQLSKMIQRNRLGAAFAVTVLVLLVALAVTSTVQSRAVARQRDRAEEEAAKALAVNRFMSETLSAANPWGAGYDVTVVEALDQAAGKIPTSFSGQPLIEAEVRHTIGTAYRNLGRYDRARPLLEAALDSRTRLLGDDDPETIATLSALAELAWRDSRYEEAVRLGRESLERGSRVFGEPSPEVAGALEDFSRILADAGLFEEAEPVVDRALAMNIEVHGERSLQAAACYENKATLIQLARRDFAAAEEFSREALAIRRAAIGGPTMDLAASVNNLGVLLLLQGRGDEALPVLQEAVEICRQAGGDRHPELARSLENLGNVYYRKREFDRTLELLGEVMTMRREVLGEDSPDVARTLNNLGMVYKAAGDPGKAEDHLRRAVAGMERAYGPDHPDVASSHWSLAHVLWSERRLAEAEVELRAAVAIAERAYPEGSAGRATFSLPLGNLLVERGRFREAEPWVRSAYEIYVATDGPDAPRTAEAASWLVKLYEAWGRPEEAARYERAAPGSPTAADR